MYLRKEFGEQLKEKIFIVGILKATEKRTGSG
jgi:hypothetical protein